MFAAILAASALKATDPADSFASQVIISHGNFIMAFVPLAEKDLKCPDIKMANTVIEPQTLGLNVVSGAFIAGSSGAGVYLYWVVDSAGVHSIYRANFIIKGCALSEQRYEQQYFDGKDRLMDAEAAYKALVARYAAEG